MDIISDKNVKLYITLDEITNPFTTFQEESIFFEECSKNCNFVSIPIKDFTAPTSEQLLKFWKLIDEFNESKGDSNVLMHCGYGKGRTGFMIMSYIWLKKILLDKKNSPFINGIYEKLIYYNKSYNIQFYNNIKTT
jgi:protein tyrosine phosphatase